TKPGDTGAAFGRCRCVGGALRDVERSHGQSGDFADSVTAVQNLAADSRVRGQAQPPRIDGYRGQEPIQLRSAGFPTGEMRRLESRRYTKELHGKLIGAGEE